MHRNVPGFTPWRARRSLGQNLLYSPDLAVIQPHFDPAGMESGRGQYIFDHTDGPFACALIFFQNNLNPHSGMNIASLLPTHHCLSLYAAKRAHNTGLGADSNRSFQARLLRKPVIFGKRNSLSCLVRHFRFEKICQSSHGCRLLREIFRVIFSSFAMTFRLFGSRQRQ